MDRLSFTDPAFAAYAIAASLMILKIVATSWLTVWRMTREKGGFRAPEDLRRTLLNPAPDPAQLAPNERVERIRRIQLNNLENLPVFLVAGLLFVLTGPSPGLARLLLYSYVAVQWLHFAAYLTARDHEVRATLWTISSLILIFITARVLLAALGV